MGLLTRQWGLHWGDFFLLRDRSSLRSVSRRGRSTRLWRIFRLLDSAKLVFRERKAPKGAPPAPERF